MSSSRRSATAPAGFSCRSGGCGPGRPSSPRARTDRAGRGPLWAPRDGHLSARQQRLLNTPQLKLQLFIRHTPGIDRPKLIELRNLFDLENNRLRLLRLLDERPSLERGAQIVALLVGEEAPQLGQHYRPVGIRQPMEV